MEARASYLVLRFEGFYGSITIVIVSKPVAILSRGVRSHAVVIDRREDVRQYIVVGQKASSSEDGNVQRLAKIAWEFLHGSVGYSDGN